MVDTIDRHLFDDEYVIQKFNYTSCVCLSCYLQKELVSIVGSYCTIFLKSLVAMLHVTSQGDICLLKSNAIGGK